MSDQDFKDTGDLDLDESVDDDLDIDGTDLPDGDLDEDLDDSDVGEEVDDESDDDDVGSDGDDEVEEADEETTLDEEEDEDEVEETEQSLDVLLVRDLPEDVGRGGDDRGNEAAGIGADEFTCRSCFLVKKRAQLADEDQLICFDCV